MRQNRSLFTHLFWRLDQILGRPGTKDEGTADLQIPLALRIFKIEQKVSLKNLQTI